MFMAILLRNKMFNIHLLHLLHYVVYQYNFAHSWHPIYDHKRPIDNQANNTETIGNTGFLRPFTDVSGMFNPDYALDN